MENFHNVNRNEFNDYITFIIKLIHKIKNEILNEINNK